MGSLERRLGRLENALGRSEEPPPADEWPIEEWTRTQLAQCSGPALYYIEYKSIEDVIAGHAEFCAVNLYFNLCHRAYQAYGPFVGQGPGQGHSEPPPFSDEVWARIEATLYPHLEFWRKRLEEAEEAREAKREMHAAWLCSRAPDRVGREWADDEEWLAEYSRRREAWG